MYIYICVKYLVNTSIDTREYLVSHLDTFENCI